LFLIVFFFTKKKPENPLRKTKSAIPAVEVPHPGTSYNPDYDDHQDLLLKAHLVELKKLKQEEKLMRQMAANAKKMSWQEIEVN
jgi:nucleolar protein 53